MAFVNGVRRFHCKSGRGTVGNLDDCQDVREKSLDEGFFDRGRVTIGEKNERIYIKQKGCVCVSYIIKCSRKFTISDVEQ